MNNSKKTSGRSLAVPLTVIFILALATGLFFWQKYKPSRTSPAPQIPSQKKTLTEQKPLAPKTTEPATEPDVVRKPIESGVQPDVLEKAKDSDTHKIAPRSENPVIDHQNTSRQPELEKLMEDRKKPLGLDKSVDLVVKPDESIKIGDRVIPMSDILEKIRLKNKQVIEDDIDPDGTGADRTAPHKSLQHEMDKIEKRLSQVDEILADPAIDPQSKVYRNALKERARLEDIKRDYENLKRTTAALDETKKDQEKATDPSSKKKASQQIEALQFKRKRLVEGLDRRVRPSAYPPMYGIYVVQPGDNIWNIHFGFLKEYFSSRGVTLKEKEDEPIGNRSSGVGKLLKYSEIMLADIYDLEENRLSSDLDLIHPLTKIVVFNLGQALTLLDQIDYENINQLEFDGQTIWLPSSLN